MDEHFYFGTILKPHGRIGEAVIKLDKNISGWLSEIKSVFLEIEGLLVPFFINSIQGLTPSTAIVKFDNIDNPDKIKELIGTNIFSDKTDIIKNDKKKYFYRDLIRFKIIDETVGEIGIINDIFLYPDNPVFQVMRQNKEILIPINKDFILKIDQGNETVLMTLPRGLTDIFG
jgi:16S rRNA processing protein RimM